MKVVALNSKLEEAFQRHIFGDLFEYYFFIRDWKLEKDKTRILLALKNEKIDGMILVYKQRIVQLRGSLEAAEALLDRLGLEKGSVTAPKEHRHIILRRYKPLRIREIIRMTLHKGEERLFIRHSIERLEPPDAEEIVNLLRDISPDLWGDIAAEEITASMKIGTLWIGIKHNGKIVSVGSTFLTEFGSNIGIVATHEANRNRGYATSIVSTLVKEILRRSKYALIHVESNNAPALHVYSKVGFKPYRTYLVIEGELKNNSK